MQVGRHRSRGWDHGVWAINTIREKEPFRACLLLPEAATAISSQLPLKHREHVFHRGKKKKKRGVDGHANLLLVAMLSLVASHWSRQLRPERVNSDTGPMPCFFEKLTPTRPQEHVCVKTVITTAHSDDQKYGDCPLVFTTARRRPSVLFWTAKGTS